MNKNELVVISRNIKSDLKNYSFPKGFSPDSALEEVAIIFAENGGFPECSRESCNKAIREMLIQGLHPLKGQCHLVPFGGELVLIRDYSGSIMVAKDSDNRIKDIRAKLVREGDIFDFQIDNGMYKILQHKPTLESLESDNFLAVYAVAVDENDEVIDAEIMVYKKYIEHIKKYCKPIKGQPVIRKDGSINPYSSHAKYPEQMLKKTVIHKLCKHIIKASPNDEITSIEESYIDNGEPIIEIREPERKVIDFKPVEGMAKKEHGREIARLSVKLGENGDMMKNISEYFKRDVVRIRELTLDEATKYIEYLSDKLNKQEPKDDIDTEQPAFMD